RLRSPHRYRRTSEPPVTATAPAAAPRPPTGLPPGWVRPRRRWSWLGVHAVVGAQGDLLADLAEQPLGLAQQVHDRRCGQPVVDRPALGAVDDQAALLQTGQVPGHVRLRRPNGFDEVHDPAFTGEELGQDRQPGRVTHAPEQLRGYR